MFIDDDYAIFVFFSRSFEKTAITRWPHGIKNLERTIDKILTHIAENETKILVNLIASMPKRFRT